MEVEIKPKGVVGAKAKAGPGRLNFEQIGSFEKSNEAKCATCKKKIIGQTYLTHKVINRLFICKD